MVLKNLVSSEFKEKNFFENKKIFFAMENNFWEDWGEKVDDLGENLEENEEDTEKIKKYPDLKIKDWIDWLEISDYNWFDSLWDYLKWELVDKIDIVKWLYSVQNKDESFKGFYEKYLEKWQMREMN